MKQTVIVQIAAFAATKQPTEQQPVTGEDIHQIRVLTTNPEAVFGALYRHFEDTENVRCRSSNSESRNIHRIVEFDPATTSSNEVKAECVAVVYHAIEQETLAKAE